MGYLDVLLWRDAVRYLALVSDFLYGDLGPTAANILIGVLSAVVDNIPPVRGVERPSRYERRSVVVDHAHGRGRRILLSIGSAAGLALMGQTRGCDTFYSHLKWTWAIALGYAAGIWTHFSLNAALL